MRIVSMLVALGLSVSSAAVVRGQALQDDSTPALQAIDKYVANKMRTARMPGLAIGVVKGNQLLFLKGYGQADGTGRPVTPQTPFLIGSVTKSFTALAVMQLVEEGKVDLDAAVQRYIPWFRVADPRASAQITVRHLLTMTSGVPQGYETQLWEDQDDHALERAVRSVAKAELRSAVGGAWTYSNANYETLGLIVQNVSGLSYEEYIKRHIFAPLDMRNSFVSQDEALQHGMADGYRWWFGIPLPVTIPYNRSELPAGYIIASAEDMTHYLIAEMNDGRFGNRSVLSAEGMALRHSKPPAADYGLGWEFVQSNGRTLINVDGGTANFQSSLFFDPQAHVGVIIVANVVNALDTFSSPHGSSVLDGSTVRAMAHAVLSMATNEPLPSQGIGHERLTLIFDAVIVLLTVALVVSLARLPERRRRLVHHGIASRSHLMARWSLAVLVNWLMPIALLYVWLFVPAWKVIAQFQPDLAYWLVVVAFVLFIRGVLEMTFAWNALHRTRHAASRSQNGNGALIRTRIVVLGGGVGGLAAARHLDRLLRRRDDVEITLVSRDNFFLLSPLLFEACSGVLELRHCAQPIRPCLRRVRFLEGTVERIDVERRVVHAASAEYMDHELPYDHVVVALGATTNLSMIPGSEHARTFKTVADGLLLRNHLIEQLERASVESDPQRRQQLLTVVVIGGGLVGVELLGELTAFIGDELRYYPEVHSDEPRFHLFEAGNRLLPESKPFLAEYAAHILRRRGAELHISTPVQQIERELVRWAGGEVHSPTIVLAAGIVPNAVAAATAVSRDRRGRILTERTLRSVSDAHVWALGDCASTPAPDGKPYPALAQNAIRAARAVAWNVAATVRGQPLKPFVYESLGTMAAFGHTEAAAEVKGLNLTGFIAWWMRRTYYLFQMPRWETRVRIAFDWTVSLFARPDLTKIDLAAEREQEQRNRAADGGLRTSISGTHPVAR